MTIGWSSKNRGELLRGRVFFLTLLVGTLAAPAAGAFTLNVAGSDGGAVGQYRYVVEEDLTFHPTPGVTVPVGPTANILALNFHRSYMPVVASGVASGSANIALPADRHYFVSVLPTTAGAYSIGGALVKPGQATVNVTLNAQPIPTAQISVFVFKDTSPINGVPDLPQEEGLAGYIINLREAGGRYGASGELILQDAFGEPLVNSALDGINDPGRDATRGTIVTNEFGVALIKNLPPAKYGITVSPPLGAEWNIQTSTIEGSPTIDAWVKPNEPPYFTEFGPAGHHADFGFTKAFVDPTVLTGGVTISGRVVSTHMSRPPDYTFWAGAPFPDCWVGLNDISGRGVYSQPCNPDSTFAIPNVPPGNWQLAIWDRNLDIIFASAAVLVNPDGSCGPGGTIPGCDLGDVAVFDWFAHLKGKVFFDTNENGFQDPGEPPLQGQAVNIRWRDGTVYQSATTGPDGEYHFAEVFPFFNWLVAEVGFPTPYKATGATIVVDGGGQVLPHNGWDLPSFGVLNPQPQAAANPNTLNNLSRTETGPVLTQAFQAFLGQTNVIDWGKAAYGPGENGGISGVVSYDTTRAENDPVFGFAENWQPGIPNVTLRLWGPGPDGLMNTADDPGVVAEVQSDSWDANLPTGCPSPNAADPFTALLGDKCYDGLRNFNQARNGVFDGGYAFATCFTVGGTGPCVDPATPGAVETALPPGEYVVEVVPPAHYKVVKAQDKNVDFGDTYTPSLLGMRLAAPPVFPPKVPCAGPEYAVPQYLSLFPNEVLHPFYDPDSPDFIRPYDPANPVMLPDCNKKLVVVSQGRNAAADFFLFTDVPVSGHVVGMILNDLANEFDPRNPNFGEKFAPSWVPVAFYDFAGREITRVYADQYGTYNALVPSTYTVNIPSPSGVAPNMLIACMNDPGPISNPAGGSMIDPYFNPQYTQFCYTFQYMPGATTYLDTPVLPIAAFAGQRQSPLDCEFPDKTPVILSVSDQTNGFGGGPYVPNTNRQITITALGPTQVLNPAYDGAPTSPLKITRDYGFGTNRGRVTLGGADLPIVSWSPGVIVATVPAGAQTGELLVIRQEGTGVNTQWIPSVMGVTLTLGPMPPGNTVRPVAPGGSIQAAIDLAQPGDLVLVPPGVYNELVVLYKDVRLQGWGAPSVTINAVKRPGEVLQAWRTKVNNIVSQAGTQYLLPGQVLNFDPANNEPGLLGTAEGPGVMVLADLLAWQTNPATPRPRIDGLTITGSDIGGAIVVNGYARNLDISNNRLISNHGFFAGGIRVGDPELVDPGDLPVDALNDNLTIHHNHITQNGSTGPMSAGGIGLFSGANGYEVTENFICGNFTVGCGAGIGHLGLSHNPAKPNLIAKNKILFNQSFDQTPGAIAEGGGISIRGIQPVGGVGLTLGAGSVTVNSNLIQGNLAGAGDGGGISLAFVDGDNAADPFVINVVNNMIVNNVSGLAAGGIALKDALGANIIHNTIANNDSTATAGAAFLAGPQNPSTPYPAGIVSRAHSPALAASVGDGFSNPVLFDNIIWQNRSFFWQVDPATSIGDLFPNAPPWDYDDLGVLGILGALDPRYCLLTDATGYDASNRSGDPRFFNPYFNGPSNLPVIPENTTPLTAAALDEGGNFIDVRYGPLTLANVVTGQAWDYHIQAGSEAINRGTTVGGIAELAFDYDGETRPFGPAVDMGADEFRPPAPPPPPVVVTPTITRTQYSGGQRRLWVYATVNVGAGTERLNARWTDLQRRTYDVPMTYNPAMGSYVLNYRPTRRPLGNVTVIALSSGRTDSKPVPFP